MSQSDQHYKDEAGKEPRKEFHKKHWSNEQDVLMEQESQRRRK